MVNLNRLATAVRTTRGRQSLRDAADEAGVNYSTIKRVENQETRPDLDTFAKLCDWMDVPMDYFREDGEHPEAVPA